MEQSKIDMFMMVNQDKFPLNQRDFIIEKLRALPEEKLMALSSLKFKEPSTMFLVSFLTGWDRFFLDDVGLGILKVLTCYGLYIWWIVDLFSVKDRTMDYNFKQLVQNL